MHRTSVRLTNEQRAQRYSSGPQDRPELVAVDVLGRPGAGVADRIRDLLNRDTGGGQERDERVPELARRPVSAQARFLRDPPELQPHVVVEYSGHRSRLPLKTKSGTYRGHGHQPAVPGFTMALSEA